MQVIQCDACGGSVVYDAAREVASCVFCGSVAVHPEDLADAIAPPDQAVAFSTTREQAAKAFAKWSRSSWWYPRELRDLSIELCDVMLPAWRFDAELETHWAGLKKARTRSGMRPTSGVARATETIMVPASLGLAAHELLALEPFHTAAAQPWDDPDADGTPMEVPSVTETAAEGLARTQLAERHRKAIARQYKLGRCNGTSLATIDTTRLVMLPIWIGSFRYRDLPWRFVINAQTGQVTGKAPISRTKVALAVVAGLVVAALAAWWRSRG